MLNSAPLQRSDCWGLNARPRIGATSSTIRRCRSSISPRPIGLHLEIVAAAAAAGKHIFCEKPVGRSPRETAEIEAIARSAGVLTFVGYNYRWAPLVLHAKSLIESGELGELTQYRGRFFSMYGSDPLGLLSWRFDKAISGFGVLGDIMAHVTDMALYLSGPIRRLVSNSHTFIEERPLPIPGKGTHYSMGAPEDPKGTVSNEDYVGALVEFENGVRGTFEASRTIFGPKNQFAFELNGTRGAMSWDFERMNELQLYLPDPDGLRDGFIRLIGGEKYPYHGRFNPGEGSGLGYEDMKIIEAFAFLKSVAGMASRSLRASPRRLPWRKCMTRWHSLLGKRGLGSGDSTVSRLTRAS